MTLRTYTRTTDARAQTGSRIVAAPDTAIEIPNTRDYFNTCVSLFWYCEPIRDDYNLLVIFGMNIESYHFHLTILA
jgi:hypothetical protein